MEGVAIDIERSHSSGSYDTDLVLEEEPQAVDEIGLDCTNCTWDYLTKGCGVVTLYMVLYKVVGG